MANNRKNKTNKPITPKGVDIRIEDGLYRLFKVWQGDKIGKEPFFITDNIEEMVDKYKECCQNWKIKPNIKYIKSFINEHKKQEVTQDEANFLKGYHGR